MRLARPDMALIVTDARALGLCQAASSHLAAADTVERAFQQLRQIADSLGRFVSSTIFVQTVAPPLEPLFGSYDRVQLCARRSRWSNCSTRASRNGRRKGA